MKTNFFTKALTTVASVARGIGKKLTSVVNLMNIGGRASVMPDITVETALENGWRKNGTVYSIVSKDMKKFASIPRYVYKKVKDGKEDKVENDLSLLLDRPNEYQSQQAFFQAVRGFYKICGESFIWLNRGDVTTYLNQSGELVQRSDREMNNMPILEMYVLPSNRVNIVIDPTNAFGVLAYEFNSGGEIIRIRKEDVIHWKNTSLDFDQYAGSHLRGMPSLKPGKQFLQQNNDAHDSATRMYQNDGARGLVYNETYNDLTPTQQSQTRDVIDSRVNNNSIKGAVATVQGKWGYLNFGGTAVDMELLQALDMSKKDLCMLFDVPHEFFIDTTYENKSQAMRGWVIHSILPDCKEFDNELNRMLLKAFKMDKSGEKIKCDYSELVELQEDMSKVVTQLAAAWWITPNEKREVQGYEPLGIPEFDEPWPPGMMTPMSQRNVNDSFDDVADEVENDSKKYYNYEKI